MRSALTKTVCWLLFLATISQILAAPKGGSGSSGGNEPSDPDYGDMLFDDTYPDPKLGLVPPTTTTGSPYQFTKTWPEGAAATVADQPRDDLDETDAEPSSFPNSEYIRLLDYSFRFFEAQRSGKLPSDQRVTWRRDSALLDGKDAGIDLSGGYFDAGDYLKFTFPLTFTMATTCWGALEFWEGYQLANQTHYLDQMVRWGMDWLIKANPNNNTLYVQVGINEVDNNYWGPDTSIPTPRPSFFVSNTKPGTDVVADASAAFAACSILYREKLDDPVYSTTLQNHAMDLFRLAETALPHQVYQAVVPAVTCCYGSTDFLDELAWGAAWMYRMTKETSFAEKSLKYIQEYNAHGVETNPATWDDKSSFVYVLMAGLTSGTPNGLHWKGLAEVYATSTLKALKPCAFTSGGLYYCYGVSGDGTSVVAANAALGMLLFAKQLSNPSTGGDGTPATQTKIASYQAFAQKQVRYLLGENPEKTPYIVGMHPNSPINPHSALASGGSSTGTIDTVPIKEAHVLYGALVGGPDRNDRFADQRSNWRQNEVALDYNAPFAALMAYQIMTSHDPPPYYTMPAGRPHHRPTIGGSTVLPIVMIVLSTLVLIMTITGLMCHHRRHQFRAWLAARQGKEALAGGSDNVTDKKDTFLETEGVPRELENGPQDPISALDISPTPSTAASSSRDTIAAMDTSVKG